MATLPTTSFFDELEKISGEITKTADAAPDPKWNPIRTGRRGALALGLGTAAYKGIKHVSRDHLEQAKDMRAEPDEKKRKAMAKKRRTGAAIDTVLGGATSAGIGYGLGHLNEKARARAAQGRTWLGDYIADSAKGIPKNFYDSAKSGVKRLIAKLRKR